MADVTLRFQGEAGNTRQVITALEKRVEKLSNRLDAAGRTSRRSGRSMTDSFRKAALQVFSLEKGLQLGQQAFQVLTQRNVEFQKSLSQTSRKLDENILKLQIQAGLSAGDLQQVVPVIGREALETPSADLAGAIDIQRQLFSSGFRAADVASGAALEASLELKAATNQFGAEVQDLAGATRNVSQFLKAQGFAEPTAGQIRTTGARITQLFKVSDIQFPDVAQLAKEAGALKDLGLSEQEQLAAFSVLSDIQGAKKGSTGLRLAATRFRKAGVDERVRGFAAERGVDTTGFDLIGESFPQALQNLNAQLAQLDKGTRSALLLRLFGEEGQTAVNLLLSNLGTVQQRLKAVESTAAFEEGVEIFRESKVAGRQRIRIREELALQAAAERQGITFEDLRGEITAQEAEARARGQGFFANLVSGVQSLQVGIAERFGLSPGPRGLGTAKKLFGLTGPGLLLSGPTKTGRELTGQTALEDLPATVREGLGADVQPAGSNRVKEFPRNEDPFGDQRTQQSRDFERAFEAVMRSRPEMRQTVVSGLNPSDSETTNLATVERNTAEVAMLLREQNELLRNTETRPKLNRNAHR